MALIKTYETETIGYEHTFPITCEGEKVYVSFVKASIGVGLGYLHTASKAVQTAIEETNDFKNGTIKLVSTSGQDDESTSASNTDDNTYPDVTDFQTAREILLKEPYNLAPTAVAKSPEGVIKAATKIGVSFPNLAV